MTVETKVNLGIEVSKFVLNEGYALADYMGRPVSRIEATTQVGLLTPCEPEYRRGWIFRHRLPREYVGGLDLSDPTWKLAVYGEKHLERMQKLATALSEKFTVDISIALMSVPVAYELEWGFGI